MKITSIFKQSTKALLANKVRTFLTILGIIIGIGSVIGLVSLGAGVQNSIDKQVKTLGSTNLLVTSGAGLASAAPNPAASGNSHAGEMQRGAALGQTQTLTKADLEALQALNDSSIAHISGTVSGSSVFKINDKDQRRTINGVLPAHFLIQQLDTEKGTTLSDDDNTNKNRVIVLGHDLAQQLFGDADPIGKEITIQNQAFTVKGVLASKTASTISNPNIVGFIPAATALETFKTANYTNFTVQASSENTVDKAKEIVEAALMKSHNITDKDLADFSVSSSKDLLSTVSEITGLLTALLAGIAAISLVVGGIGIMNIMLVAVTERTREIGLRKAVGAKTYDILAQFILESVLLTLIGGILGIGLGYLIGSVANHLSPLLKPEVTTDALLMAVGISSGIGILFGVYPAARAAQLNPIDALRYE